MYTPWLHVLLRLRSKSYHGIVRPTDRTDKQNGNSIPGCILRPVVQPCVSMLERRCPVEGTVLLDVDVQSVYSHQEWGRNMFVCVCATGQRSGSTACPDVQPLKVHNLACADVLSRPCPAHTPSYVTVYSGKILSKYVWKTASLFIDALPLPAFSTLVTSTGRKLSARRHIVRLTNRANGRFFNRMSA